MAARPALAQRSAQATEWGATLQPAQERAELPSLAEPAAGSPPPGPSPMDVRDRISERFFSESVDSAWTQQAVGKLERILPPLLPAGSVMRRVECRSSMCRVESAHQGIDEFGTFVRNAFASDSGISEGGFFAGVLAEPQPGQPVVTVAYVARRGHSLPMPERGAP
ncbi:MAG TPA: hypothetical protein PKU97_01910 [Kofleriaceae bacterium]|nr:hypothetical protein [Kofleriaceae bacterium]